MNSIQDGKLQTSKDVQKVFSSVQFSSVAQSILCDPMNRSTPGFPVHHQLPEFTQTHIHQMPSSHLILCRPLLLLPPVSPRIGVFSSESTLRMKWPNYWVIKLINDLLFLTLKGLHCLQIKKKNREGKRNSLN